MTIWNFAWGLADVFLKYRFLHKMLGAKSRYAFVWFYLGSFLYGNANKLFVLAGTTLENFVYLYSCALLLNVLLFQGSMVKKCFFTLWIYCAAELVFCAVFPLFYGAALLNGARYCPEEVIDAVGVAAQLVQYVMMEILQRKLHLLKRDFADQDAFYLMYIIVFIYAAVSMLLNFLVRIEGWPKSAVLAASVSCSLSAAAGAGLHVFCVVMLERRLLEGLARQQYQMLGQQVEVFREQYDRSEKMRHDMKNHGLCLAQLLAEKKTEEAVRYLEQLDIRMEQGKAVIQTGSVYVDALLNPKFRQAQKLGINISIEISVPGEEQIAAVDLCCLLANALDNAIEACERGIRAGAPAGWIRMQSKTHTHYWVVEIGNSMHAPVSMEQGKILSSKRMHFADRPARGVGLQNIQAVVDYYGGVLEVSCKEAFTLTVMLPLSFTAKKNPSAPS